MQNGTVLNSPQMTQVNAVIAAGASLSGSIFLGGSCISSINIPSNWTAANITLQGSFDGVNFFNLYDNAGSEIVLTAVANTILGIPRTTAIPCLIAIKVRSGTNGAPVNQVNAVTVPLLVRDYF